MRAKRNQIPLGFLVAEFIGAGAGRDPCDAVHAEARRSHFPQFGHRPLGPGHWLVQQRRLERWALQRPTVRHGHRKIPVQHPRKFSGKV